MSQLFIFDYEVLIYTLIAISLHSISFENCYLQKGRYRTSLTQTNLTQILYLFRYLLNTQIKIFVLWIYLRHVCIVLLGYYLWLSQTIESDFYGFVLGEGLSIKRLCSCSMTISMNKFCGLYLSITQFVIEKTL